MNWLKDLSGKIRFNEPLSRHTTFGIGGAARFFFQPRDIADLRRLVINTKKDNLRILIIGAGSNLLINDKGIDGFVVALNTPAFKKIDYSHKLLEVGAGLSLAELIKFALDYNLSGCEFLAGIPGTLGGALVMNAGISETISAKRRSAVARLRTSSKVEVPKSKNISDLVKDVTVMDYNGNIKVLKKKDIRFDYRVSSLYNYIVLNARLKLFKKNKREIRNVLRKYLELRKKKQDCSSPNAGCIFKNPQGLSSGKLIDMCGLKGKRFGDACVSNKHANFIINKGKAKAKDVLRLIDYIKKVVENKFAIELETEIRIWQN